MTWLVLALSLFCGAACVLPWAVLAWLLME
jgi:hypothetical protein